MQALKKVLPDVAVVTKVFIQLKESHNLSIGELYF